MTSRRHLLTGGVALAGLATAGLRPAWAQIRSADVPRADEATLRFDPDAFQLLTATLSTGQGDRVVTYRFWKALPYVSRPVDAAYQSLNVSVPVSIDGVPVDVSRAPILFSNSVGGYMPSSVAEASGVGGGEMMGPQRPAGAASGPPPGASVGVPTGGNAMMARGRRVSNAKLALAAGYVVVEPGARGRTLVDGEGTHYGVAPAAIVDLKAAVRYVRHNRGRIPGDVDRIVSSGTSAGGALSALLAASGDSPLYKQALEEVGAADASDAIFACGAWCPITDLEHADGAYEWNWGRSPLATGATVDPEVSDALRTQFAAYQASLGLQGREGFGPLTTETYGSYLVGAYLKPAAERFLAALSPEARDRYLAETPWLGDTGAGAFTWSRFIDHVGPRKKNAPAFDPFDLSSGENNLFGSGRTAARHFTTFSLRRSGDAPDADIDADLPTTLAMMNPMGFIARANPGRAKHWWLRVGTKDTDTALTVVGNLAAALEGQGDQVNALMYWDAGHGANEDADDFIRWIAETARA